MVSQGDQSSLGGGVGRGSDVLPGGVTASPLGFQQSLPWGSHSQKGNEMEEAGGGRTKRTCVKGQHPAEPF